MEYPYEDRDRMTGEDILNNAHLSHFSVKKISEELITAKMSCHVHPEQLEECVYVVWVISDRVWSCGCGHVNNIVSYCQQFNELTCSEKEDILQALGSPARRKEGWSPTRYARVMSQ